ncbi:type II secretion system F family protein [Mumia sp. zg.B21]|uniref:type II secretion system F family protein n=1 Tax=Mumia sp. zg.B21 TaxID=2855447 RepID=UPI001C6E315A|nr:type II secretion system F family protein [Mumia sp. zg.B21]MBW9209071.1 type II secretion system F family protein [Mumia sp. zg.B21]
MTAPLLGALLAAGVAIGLLELVRVARLRQRPSLVSRIEPFVRDVTVGMPALREGVESWAAGRAVFGPAVRRTAGVVERVLGGSASVRRRLRRQASTSTLEEFRASQVVWGVAAFGASAAVLLSWGMVADVRPLAGLFLCVAAGVAGVLARDLALTHEVLRHEERVTREFPTLADLLALAVAAGEGPVSALERVADVSNGAMSRDLRTVVADVRTGRPLADALDDLSARTGVPAVARFAETLAVAVERGTPLVDVLHAQAADVREAGRRELVESGARREVLMLVPVVFLVLPVTVLFAFYPGLVSLSVTTP